MLKRLFTSKVRVKLLQIFLNNLDQEFFIRELTRTLDEQINSVRRELDNLKKIGLLTFKTKNRKKYYTVNKNFTLIDELKSIINKGENTNNDLVDKILKLGNVELLILLGSFVNKESPVDLLVVGDINKENLSNLLDKNTDKAIKFSLMPKEDFYYRLKLNDSFIINTIKDNDKIVIINKLESDIKHL